MQMIDAARVNFVQCIQAYWEVAAKQNRVIKKFKTAAMALFHEENPQGDPYELVCRSEPPHYAKGYSVLKYEIVPAWALYLSRAATLMEVLETARTGPYDYSR